MSIITELTDDEIETGWSGLDATAVDDDATDAGDADDAADADDDASDSDAADQADS